MALNTKYTFDELYNTYKEQYQKSLAQLGEGASPKREMYSKNEFIQDWKANKSSNKGMSGVRVAQKIARSDVYLYSKKQAEAVYSSLFEENLKESKNLKERLDNLNDALKGVKKKRDKDKIQKSIEPLEKELKKLKKERTQFISKYRTGKIGEELEEDIENLYTDIGDYYNQLKSQGLSSKEIKQEIGKKYFPWYYL